MKTRRSKITPWLGALLCLSLALAAKAGDDATPSTATTAQDTSASPKPGEQGMQPAGVPYDAMQERSTDTKTAEGAPTRINKARGILGMAVRSQNDERLGHIKDFVIDWKTEQVSYAVISTAPKASLGLGGKMVAVPLAALTPSADHKFLILNTDKAKLEAASGFTADNWPSVGNPSWGAQPAWQQDATTAPLKGQPPAPPDTQHPRNVTPGNSSVPDPNSNLGEEPSPLPEQEPPAKPAEPDSGADGSTKPDQTPGSSPSPTPDGK
jgi:sporulation protein YlmC with PRC-barrel domain